MTPLEAYARACRRADTARAAEQAALQAARESGCTLQELAGVRGLTRAGVAYLLKTRQPAEGSARSPNRENVPTRKEVAPC